MQAATVNKNAHVGKGFWSKKKNQRSFMQYLASKFNIIQPQDWAIIKKEDIIQKGGGTMLDIDE